MTPLDQLKTKYKSIQDGTVTNDKTKIALLVELRRKGIDTTSRRYLKDELISLSKNNNISIHTITKRIDYGWTGTQKGMLQVLFQRGFIDASHVKTARSSRY